RRREERPPLRGLRLSVPGAEAGLAPRHPPDERQDLALGDLLDHRHHALTLGVGDGAPRAAAEDAARSLGRGALAGDQALAAVAIRRHPDGDLTPDLGLATAALHRD